MLTITNSTNYKIGGSLLERTAEKADQLSGASRLKEISLVFVTENKIKNINRQYRRKNKATDVLSFEGLNEIFICPSFIQKQAKKSDIPFIGELMRAFIHGILHLKGFDHEKGKREADKMRRLEEKILRNINGRTKR